MTAAQTAYLAMVIIGFSLFGVVMLFTSWWSSQAPSAARTRTAQRPARDRSAMGATTADA